MVLRGVAPVIHRPIASMQHGYLWIGGASGPCMVAISGRKTLLKLARLIRRYAR
jgi:hypothetical protein